VGRKPSIDEETEILCQTDFVVERLTLREIAAKRRVSESALERLSAKKKWPRLREEFEAETRERTEKRVSGALAEAIATEAAQIVIEQRRQLNIASKLLDYYGEVDENGKPIRQQVIVTMDGPITVPMLGDARSLKAWIDALAKKIDTERTVWGMDNSEKREGPSLLDAHQKIAEREASFPKEWKD
jgi:crotonobetainyl-CoA:carnitine CoA-transferase CaiB-like acyl-CoA transferase